MYGLTLNTGTIGEPVSVAEAREWVRLTTDQTYDDALLQRLIRGARTYVEKRTGRQLLTATWTLSLDGFPPAIAGGSGRWGGFPSINYATYRDWLDPWTIRMPKAPLQSVTQITYYDLNNALQTLASTVYDVDTSKDPGVVSLGQYQIWPITRLRPGAVQIQFVAGYGQSSDVPEDIKDAMMMLVLEWYERDRTGKEIPPAVEALLAADWNGALEYGTP